jgi:hypothetical protein
MVGTNEAMVRKIRKIGIINAVITKIIDFGIME